VSAEQVSLVIAIEAETTAESNELAGDLTDFLAHEAPAAIATRERDDPLAQDFGATLAIVLGSTAVTALAKGVAAWLARRQDARLRLRRVGADGQVRELAIDGQVGSRAEKLVTEFFAD